MCRQLAPLPRELNPADLPTRGVTGKDLVDNKLWFEGPEFLRGNNDQHVSAKVELEMNEVVLKEIASEPLEITHSLLNKVNCENIEFEMFSSKLKLIRVAAYVLRFVSNLKASIKKRAVLKSNELESEEIISAENFVVKFVQREYFSEELSYLKGKKVGEIPIYVKQFNLIIDTEGNSIIRCQTGLQNANVNVIESAPLLTSTRSYFARLIIQESHERVFHNGIAQTLSHKKQALYTSITITSTCQGNFTSLCNL